MISQCRPFESIESNRPDFFLSEYSKDNSSRREPTRYFLGAFGESPKITLIRGERKRFADREKERKMRDEFDLGLETFSA